LRAVDIAAAAAAGVSEILVRRRPVVAVLPTGDEIRPLGTEPGVGEILDTNSLMLAGQAGEHGCDVLSLPIEPDDPDRIAAAVLTAAERADRAGVTTPRQWSPGWARWQCTVWRCAQGIPWCSAPRAPPRCSGRPDIRYRRR
jgi:hypothetical protein